MKVPLLYGKKTLEVELPDSLDVTVIRKPDMPLVADPYRATVGCLESVVERALGCRTACILVCDVTRPVPNSLFLRSLIEQLMTAGIDRKNITILIATGLHRPNEGDELASLIGDDWVLDNIRIVNHVARNDEEHVDLGVTRSGTPVKLDRRFLDADFKVATGLVEPHFMAGWSGGRKVIVPGVAHADTIRTLHSARFIEDPLTRECNLEGNPLHDEQLEIVAMVRDRCQSGIYALNTVIDEARQLAFVNFGEIESSHAEAAHFADKYCVVDVGKRFDVVVTSAAGFPLDLTYYQAIKGFVTPLDILKSDATLVVASECAEGIGSESFRKSQRLLLQEGPNTFLRRIEKKRLADIDEWETEMQLKATRATRVQLYSEGLRGIDRELTGVEMVDSLQEAVDASISRTVDPSVAIIPEGPYVVPRYAA
ncbi:MAG: nickel-dependent lactate racemase [Gammaproteobacteria bacterium]|nr:nickel-dependent lactate racemase [Gammaproteobacteria bacterium]